MRQSWNWLVDWVREQAAHHTTAAATAPCRRGSNQAGRSTGIGRTFTWCWGGRAARQSPEAPAPANRQGILGPASAAAAQQTPPLSGLSAARRWRVDSRQGGGQGGGGQGGGGLLAGNGLKGRQWHEALTDREPSCVAASTRTDIPQRATHCVNIAGSGTPRRANHHIHTYASVHRMPVITAMSVPHVHLHLHLHLHLQLHSPFAPTSAVPGDLLRPLPGSGPKAVPRQPPPPPAPPPRMLPAPSPLPTEPGPGPGTGAPPPGRRPPALPPTPPTPCAPRLAGGAPALAARKLPGPAPAPAADPGPVTKVPAPDMLMPTAKRLGGTPIARDPGPGSRVWTSGATPNMAAPLPVTAPPIPMPMPAAGPGPGMSSVEADRFTPCDL